VIAETADRNIRQVTRIGDQCRCDRPQSGGWGFNWHRAYPFGDTPEFRRVDGVAAYPWLVW